MKKKEYKFSSFMNAFIIAGMIILVLGLYYAVKANVPYQDPTIELQIQYAVDERIGNLLTKIGFFTALCSGLVRIVYSLLSKKLQKSVAERNS